MARPIPLGFRKRLQDKSELPGASALKGHGFSRAVLRRPSGAALLIPAIQKSSSRKEDNRRSFGSIRLWRTSPQDDRRTLFMQQTIKPVPFAMHIASKCHFIRNSRYASRAAQNDSRGLVQEFGDRLGL